MPWPFRRHRAPDAGAAQRAAGPSSRPVTIDDLAARRRLNVHAGGWQKLAPLTPSATGAAAPVVSSGASFIAHLAGAQPLLPSTSLREVSSDAPRGLTHGLARPLPESPYPPAPEPAAGTEQPGEQIPPPETTHRPVIASGVLTRHDLTSYVGDLVPAEPEPDVFAEPERFDHGGLDEIPEEELPPPIFTSLLAERTGRELADLRPDLAGMEAGGEAPVEEPEIEQLARRRSLAESRRLGLGAPLPSGPFDVANREQVEDEPFELEAAVPEPLAHLEAPEPIASPEPATRAVAHYRSTEVPSEVRTDVSRALGRDPGAVRVRREREVSDVASRIGARAFTREGEVFLPMEAGPLDSPETRAVLAHELTHVVQQRVYGSSLPRPSSAEGQRLEAEAHAVERFVRGDDPEPLVAPIRTLRATPGDPRIDSGGFTRAVTEQLVARGAAHWDTEGALVFPPPHPSATGNDEWRAPSGLSANANFQTALQQDQQASLEYERGRGATPAADRDRAENERHLRFVHAWQPTLAQAGDAASRDAQTSLDYERSRGPNPDAPTDGGELERHMKYVHDSQQGGGGGEFKEIEIVSGGFGAALGLTEGLFSAYDRSAEERAGRMDAPTAAQVGGTSSARPAGQVSPPGSGQPGSQTTATAALPTTPTPSTTTPTTATPTPTPTTPAPATPAPLSGGAGSQDTWAKDDDIRLIDPTKQAAGLGVAFGLFADVTARSDEDLFHDTRFGMHEIPQQAATTPTAATPATQPGAAPAVQAAQTPAVAGAGAAVAGGAQAATHHQLEAAGTRPRERSIDGTDPTDIVAHLDDQDLEDLATLLFDRLQTRLRRDLIVDRERTGFLTDFR
jgi:hypothetical protein